MKHISSVGTTKRFITFLFLFVSLLIVGFIIDSVLYIEKVLEESPILAYSYIALFGVVSYLIVSYIFREIAKFLEISKVEKLQQEIEALKKLPTNEVLKVANILVTKYSSSPIPEVREGIEKLRGEISNISNENILSAISQYVLSPIDREVEKVIFKYAKETGMMTAISPFPLLDGLFIIWRNIRMVNEITQLYGFRAGLFGNLLLLRRVGEQLVFIGVTEIVSEGTGLLAGQTLTSKLSKSLAEGMGNALFTLRVGIATIEVTRPIREEGNISIVKRFLSSFNPFKK
ncbi:MAG TPA: DUF697 domain-containing protein [Campylobacterales bacterium]|nr:DUF697 domain-containing protein [Campylobacterales bacterium]HIO71281.1 DUF697 domain-containing protein [Campylobacterales bacterium]